MECGIFNGEIIGPRFHKGINIYFHLLGGEL